ncbi:MAG: hypothetical protein JXQ90_21080 [Cyclobacteriaceae bacterium]
MNLQKFFDEEPRSKPFDNLSIKEAQDYLEWLVGNRDTFITSLSRKVGFEVNSSSENFTDISAWIVDNRNSNSYREFIFETAVLFAERLINNVTEDLEWAFISSPPSDMFVNQPLIRAVNDHTNKCAVLEVVFNTCHQIKSKQVGIYELTNAYQLWKKIFQEGSTSIIADIFKDLDL